MAGWDAHFQKNMPGLLAEAPEPSMSQVMGWAPLSDPGKLRGLVHPHPRCVLTEQAATRRSSLEVRPGRSLLGDHRLSYEVPLRPALGKLGLSLRLICGVSPGPRAGTRKASP